MYTFDNVYSSWLQTYYIIQLFHNHWALNFKKKHAHYKAVEHVLKECNDILRLKTLHV